LNIAPHRRHDGGVTRSEAVDPPVSDGAARPGFDEVYAAWFHEVCRWLHAMGCREADLEDLAQELFLVVRRKLDRFDGRNLPGWLYAIALRVASGHRRRAWVRRVFFRDSSTEIAPAPSPADLLERKEGQLLLDGVLGAMSARRRTAFVLFEIEGYSGEEIARLEGVPEATVRTRLFHARKEFRERLRKIGGEGR
jgi:RNA polymerase sigma-70 factor (ECF subfamily)